MNLGTFNTRTLSSKARLAELLEELRSANWDIVGLKEVKKTGEAYTILNHGHIICCRGLLNKKEFGMGFLMHAT